MGDHEDEFLNYVCVDKKCKQLGLLCSICKEDHHGHTIYPLKMLLKSLEKNSSKPLEASEGFQFPLE